MTPREVLNAALAKSMRNRTTNLSMETEGLQVVVRAVRGIFSVAARVNPTYFGEVASVEHDGTGWPRPPQAELIFRIERDGDEVVPVPFDERTIADGEPSVYELGGVFRPAGNDDDPTEVDDLTFYFSARPDSPADIDSPIDERWDETFVDLLIDQVALYLATKAGDTGREAEIAELTTSRDQWLSLFVAHLEHATVGIPRRHAPRFNSPSLVTAKQILGGD